MTTDRSPRTNGDLYFKIPDELICFLCKGVLKDPMLTKECLHRFCSRCIQREVMVNGLKNCPTCNRALPNKVPFKSDSNYAHIISKMLQHDNMKTPQKLDVSRKCRSDGVDVDRYQELAADCASNSEWKCDRTEEATSSGGCAANNSFTHEKGEKSLKRPSEVSSNQKAKVPKKLASNISGLSHHITDAFANEHWSTHAKRRLLFPSQMVELSVWPDASVYQMSSDRVTALPARLRVPRFLNVPPDATVKHLAEYLLLRAEVESGWSRCSDTGEHYRVEFTLVEECDEFTLRVCKSRNVDYLRMKLPSGGCDPSGLSSSMDDCLLVMKNNHQAGGTHNVMLRTRHPFRTLPDAATVAEIQQHLTNGNGETCRSSENPDTAKGRKKLLKLIFRVVKQKCLC